MSRQSIPLRTRLVAGGFTALTILVASCGCDDATFGSSCDSDDHDASAGIQGFLTKTKGDGKSVPAGTDISLEVFLANVNESALCGHTITWTPGANSGSASPVTSETAADGTTVATWTLGPTVGQQTLTATVNNSIPTLSVIFTATATGGSHPIAEVSMYNLLSTAGVTASVETPFQGTVGYGTLSTLGLTTKNLQVEVGEEYTFTASVGSKTGTITCTAAAGIIPGPQNPGNTGTALVSVSADPAEGVFLQCISGGWE